MTLGTVAVVPLNQSEKTDFLLMAKAHFVELNPCFRPDDDWERCYFEQILSNPDLFLHWITLDDRRVGFILYGFESHRFLPRRTGVIYEMYLIPEYRRHGVGRRVALHVIAELRLHSPSKIQLEVTEGNQTAAAFWRSLGFEPVTQRYVLLDQNQ